MNLFQTNQLLQFFSIKKTPDDTGGFSHQYVKLLDAFGQMLPVQFNQDNIYTYKVNLKHIESLEILQDQQILIVVQNKKFLIKSVKIQKHSMIIQCHDYSDTANIL